MKKLKVLNEFKNTFVFRCAACGREDSNPSNLCEPRKVS